MAQFGSKLIGITKNLQKSSTDILKTTKLSINLANEEERLRNIYVEIGRKVHEIYSYGGSLGGVFDEKYLELKASEEKIGELKKMLEAVKGTRECPSCKKSVSLSYEFCPKCGSPMTGDPATGDIALPDQADTTDPEPYVNKPAENPIDNPIDNPESYPVNPPAKKTCPVCGAPNEPNIKFCFSCGRLL